MKKNIHRFLLLCSALTALICFSQGQTPSKSLPESLKPWQDWATWKDKQQSSPTPYNDGNKYLGFWPSRLSLEINRSGGRFDLGLTVYHESWITLPGGTDLWPLEVRANGVAVPVLEHNHLPSLRLAPGTYRLNGLYRWDEMPQRVSLPRDIGLLTLTLEGKTVETPAWDAEGFLWLKRTQSEEADKNFLSVKVYRVIEDGIPMWLRTEVELSVSGKSREETLGSILPEGWQLALVDSPIPVAVDEAGQLKAQVRAGKWTISLNAFRLNHAAEFRYAEGAKPSVEQELIAFQAKPEFRMTEVTGVPSIDVSQTTFPEKWREFPVYSWETKSSFKLEERMRGMGLQKPEGLKISRELWLDENGKGLTFRDRISGNMQQIWRLDAAENQDLGSVRSSGQGQLITKNPHTGAPGIEVRTRNIDLEATGRMDRAKGLSATGWRSDADSVSTSLKLPPGWRLLALFGADYVEGDWLTSWTLLDLFLLLVFSLAVFRLWGIPAGILAFCAFGLAYHESDAPRYIWLILLIPLALLRVVTQRTIRRLLVIWKYTAITVLVLILIPFIAVQITQILYPQLENTQDDNSSFLGLMTTGSKSKQTVYSADNEALNAPEALQDMAQAEVQPNEAVGQADGVTTAGVRRSLSTFGVSSVAPEWQKKSAKGGYNLNYDAKARIQTGPGVPDWSWREVSFGWNGPVLATQQVYPVLISLPLQRLISVLRIALLLALSAVLLGIRRNSLPRSIFQNTGRITASVLLMAGLLFTLQPQARAQYPDKEMINTLRERLLEKSDAFPNAADIPSVTLSLNGKRLTMDAEIHTAVRVAAPLPGRLPSWSPLSVSVNGQPEAVLRRSDGYLWVVLPAGVNRVKVEGMLPDITEWEWTFLLKPRKVAILAPDWNVSGIRPDGVPEQQLFFTRKQKSASSEASYDHQDYRSLAVVTRRLELGLEWQVSNSVTRLSSAGKAVSIRVPLLPGEKILSSTVTAKDGYVEVRLGAHENAFNWESELPVTTTLLLSTKNDDSWVERWHLVTSPVWNVSLSGLPPVFEASSNELVPVWQPWPGEKVELSISRPEAINGATITAQKVQHEITLGSRQRSTRLDLQLQCSLGEDFIVKLPSDAEITMLTHNGKAIPVRKDGDQLVVPLRPGLQSLSIQWKTNQVLGFHAAADSIRLPVESANIRTVIQVPENRWVLWAGGPQRGPAVRFWGILAFSILAAWILGRLSFSPLKPFEWVLLVIGLTQVNLFASLAIIVWLFLLAWRGRDSFQKLPAAAYNILQIVLVILSFAALGILISVVSAGLLGQPEMFIEGNGSGSHSLNWYLARAENLLPQPSCLSVSIWFYRFLMLAWALWLAASLLRWLKWAWQQFSTGPLFQTLKKSSVTPPPLS